MVLPRRQTETKQYKETNIYEIEVHVFQRANLVFVVAFGVSASGSNEAY